MVPFGTSAWRLELPRGLDPRQVRARLLGARGVAEVVLTERHALVTFDPALPPDDLGPALAGAASAATNRAPATEHRIRVRYDGPDLPRVASLTGLAPDAIVELHRSRLYEVRVIGFLPGFAYLGEVDPRIAVPRLDAPRPRVPLHAVGMAGPRTGVYPCASPGGWNLIGTAVDFVAFDPERGARLAVGDTVRFMPA